MSESAKIYSKEGPKIEKIEVLPPPPAQLRIVDYKHDVIIKPDNAITVSVMEDLKLRADRGIKKYNTTLQQNNKDDFMNHLYEELLDAAQYCKKELSFTKEIQKIIDSNPNDQKLGEIIRSTYGK